MGMLSGIDPEESYSKGFKDNLTSEMANTIALAKRQWTWCNERGLSLGALALQSVQSLPLRLLSKPPKKRLFAGGP